VNKLDQSKLEVDDDDLKDGCTEVNVSAVAQILTPSSPVLGRSSEKRLRRAKDFLAAKSEECVHDKATQDLSVVSSENCALLCGCSINSAQQKSNLYSNFDNDYPITLEAGRRTEDDKGLKQNQKCENYNVFGVGAESSSRIKENVKLPKELKWAEEKTSSVQCVSQYLVAADITVETKCNGIDIKKNIQPSSLEDGKALIEDGQCGIKSVNADSDVLLPSNILCRADSVLLKGKEQKCNAEVKKDNPDGVMSSELLIETETSLDISMNNTSEHRNDVAQVDSLLL
jgi:transcription elongation factor Elf1